MELPKLSQPPDNVDPKTRIPEFKNFLAELETLRRVLTDAETKLVSITQKCKIYFEGYSYACDLHLMLVDGLKTINDGVYEVEEKFHANYDAETGEKKRQVEARTEDDDAVFQLLLSPQATMKSEEQDEPAENLAPPTEETSEHQFIPEASTVPAESYEPSSPRTEEESCSDWDPDDEVPPPNYQEDYNSEDNQVENSDSQPQQHPPVPPIKISNLLKRRASQSLQRKIKKSQKQHEQKIASAPRNFAARSSSEPPIIISPLTPPPLIKRKRGRPRSIFPNQTIPWGGPIPVPGPPESAAAQGKSLSQ
ncbi:uncharacterized protein LOC110858975 [Folsomia candida]|uniref:uncharacterized protein LOC110858975 n=1 Tax=Folsomia candida TaxID=158441 RepID=UPI000B902A70|nr:uncharacterized protein LOC110858975 [Folsomia candida]